MRLSLTIVSANAIRVAGVEHAAVYAPKSALGHSIGAVGALESVLTATHSWVRAVT